MVDNINKVLISNQQNKNVKKHFFIFLFIQLYSLLHKIRVKELILMKRFGNFLNQFNILNHCIKGHNNIYI
jgi:hypothetical protein